MREIKLGLGDPPVRRYLFIGQDEGGSGACWYERDHDHNANIHVPERAITGYITGIRCAEHDMGRHGMKWKVDILLDAGQPFAIRSGMETVFVRGIVLALHSLLTSGNEGHLGEALTFVVTPSKEQSKIVFGSVYLENGSRVKFTWDKDLDIAPLVTELQGILGDGGQGDDEGREDEEPRSREPRDSGPSRQTAPGKANDSQIKELRRVADVKQIDLRDECARLYPHAVNGVEDLTTNEAIEFRKTLMAL